MQRHGYDKRRRLVSTLWQGLDEQAVALRLLKPNPLNGRNCCASGTFVVVVAACGFVYAVTGAVRLHPHAVATIDRYTARQPRPAEVLKPQAFSRINTSITVSSILTGDIGSSRRWSPESATIDAVCVNECSLCNAGARAV